MSRTLWLVVGIISILGGIFAFFNPLSASFAAEQLAGFVLSVSYSLLPCSVLIPRRVKC